VKGPSISHVARLDVRCVERCWQWAEQNSDAIAAFWRDEKARQPNLFDGPVFMLAEPRIEGATLHALAFETRFSNLLYAKRAGFPDPEAINGFAMPALRARDGAFLLGVMGADTANGGQIYFPAGTPDPKDRRGDVLDLMGSVSRELAEETGLEPGDYDIGEGWVLVRDGGLLAFMRPVRVTEKAEQARERMLARMRRLKEQELSDIYIARTTSDVDERRMPAFVQTFLRWSFDQKSEENVTDSRSAASSP
jgi:8-oxo-dGTP pyrophosphatase MutT (NUDIX family)